MHVSWLVASFVISCFSTFKQLLLHIQQYWHRKHALSFYLPVFQLGFCWDHRQCWFLNMTGAMNLWQSLFSTTKRHASRLIKCVHRRSSVFTSRHPTKPPAYDDKHDLSMLFGPRLMRAGQLGSWMCCYPQAEQYQPPFPPVPERQEEMETIGFLFVAAGIIILQRRMTITDHLNMFHMPDGKN